MGRLNIRPIPVLAALAAVALTVSLGNWQTRRADEKEALQRRADRLAQEPPVNLGAQPVAAELLDRRRVVVRGEWVAGKAIYLDHRQRQGVVGYEVLMPLRIEGGERHVLVNRGWVKAGAQRDAMPAVATPAGILGIEGEARASVSRYLELGHEAARGRVWQNVSLEEYAAWSGLSLQPVMVLQTGAADDGLLRVWPRPDYGIDRHRGYALQWYGLAALVLVLSLVLGLGKRKSDEA